jgi:hypothetical protein
MLIKDLPTAILDRYIANHQVIYLETDEPQRCIEAIEAAVKLIQKHDRGNPKTTSVTFDKYAGVYRGQPGITRPVDGSNKLINVLPLAVAGTSSVPVAFKKLVEGKERVFSIEDDIIFVLKEVESELFGAEGQQCVQFLKNMAAANMGSKGYALKNDLGDRGQRMLIFISATAKLPTNLPEFHPVQVPLPDKDVLRGIVDATFSDIDEVHKETKGERGWVTPPDTRDTLATSLTGLTYQAAEDALSLAVATHGRASAEMDGKTLTLKRVDPIIEVIEGEKAIHISGIPGLEYVSREMTSGIQLAGYEEVVEFVQAGVKMDAAKAAKHKMKAINGVSFVGPPGTGKTMIGYLMSQITGRILIKWSLGESKGGIVGQSEANARRAIQIGQAMGAVMLLDDIDKGMLGGGGGSSYGGDGGTSGNMVSMLLTEMSKPDNKAIWCFTLNRVQNVSPELIRPGRMDGVFYVQRPDEVTRLEVAKIHLAKRNFAIDSKQDEEALHKFAYELTPEWVPAEIEAKIVNVARRSLLKNDGKFNFEWLNEDAKLYTPMAQQEAYKADMQAMEAYSQQFIKIGRGKGVASSERPKKVSDGGRASRSLA